MSIQKEPSDKNTNLVLVIIVVILVIILLAGMAGFGCWYIYHQAKESSTAQVAPTMSASSVTTSTNPIKTYGNSSELSPSEVVEYFIKYTVGTVDGSSLDSEAAQDLVSSELAQKINDSSFAAQAFCMQQGPDEIQIDSANVYNNTEGIVRVKALWGNDWQTPWEFELVDGENGWKIKTITCLDTGQMTQ